MGQATGLAFLLPFTALPCATATDVFILPRQVVYPSKLGSRRRITARRGSRLDPEPDRDGSGPNAGFIDLTGHGFEHIAYTDRGCSVPVRILQVTVRRVESCWGG